MLTPAQSTHVESTEQVRSNPAKLAHFTPPFIVKGALRFVDHLTSVADPGGAPGSQGYGPCELLFLLSATVAARYSCNMKLCVNCGTAIQHNNRSTTKFCSLRCFGLNQQRILKERRIPNIQCSWCSKHLYRNQSQIKRSVSKHGRAILFCDRACRYKAQKLDGVKEIHPNHYGKSTTFNYRVAAFEAYEKCCVRCGYDRSEFALDVHHKDHDHSNNEISNLEVLCCNCHMIEHRSRGNH